MKNCQMELTELGIKGAWIVESDTWPDNRGSFREWFKPSESKKVIGFEFSVEQANLSISAYGVVRGIHYSIASEGQAKWVTCAHGEILDFIIDLRINSATYKKVESVRLLGNGNKSVLIGPGLGHAFVSLAQGSAVTYLLSSPYKPELEFGINPFDQTLKLDFGIPVNQIVVSEKDKLAPTLNEQEISGLLPTSGLLNK
jgi:dTDP-4-dehydrorhamnose 3,5-epimerase